MGGNQYVSDDSIFVTECDIGSATIIPSPIPDYITYIIDG